MSAVLLALGTMAAVAAIGWVLGRTRALGPGADGAIARVVFLVAVPALLIVTVAHADLHLLLSRVALVTVASTSVVVLVSAAILRLALRRPAAETVVGTLAASYLNAAHLGIPIAVYLLGDAVAVVPTLLFQLLVLAPVALTVLDRSRQPGRRRAGHVLARSARNPIIRGAVVGLVLAALPWDLPEAVYEPFRLVGAAAAPLALLAFGMSLAAPRSHEGHMLTPDLALAVVMRSVVHPALALLLGRALGLERPALLAVVTMAALPTAQNVLVYALQYGRGSAVARDAGLVTTVLAFPLMLAIAAFLS